MFGVLAAVLIALLTARRAEAEQKATVLGAVRKQRLGIAFAGRRHFDLGSKAFFALMEGTK